MITLTVKKENSDDETVQHNPIGKLQELCLARSWPPPSYDLVEKQGLPHKLQFSMACHVLKFREVCTWSSKQLAKKMAAYKMLMTLQDIPQDFDVVEHLSEEVNNLLLKDHTQSPHKEKLSLMTNFEEYLSGIAARQSFNVIYTTIEDETSSGRCQCLVQISTIPMGVCCGAGGTVKEARENAARDALDYLTLITKNVIFFNQ